MTIPEIERMSSTLIQERLDYVKNNIDLITKVEERTDMIPDGFTKIHVTFSFLKKVVGGSAL